MMADFTDGSLELWLFNCPFDFMFNLCDKFNCVIKKNLGKKYRQTSQILPNIKHLIGLQQKFMKL